MRVIDFAFKVNEFANTIVFKNGKRLKLKIAVHSGEIYGGVIGEVKPHFTIIGYTLNMTKAIIDAQNPNHKKIVISGTVKQALE